ncbi:MAG: hypothetical protein ABWX74_14435 [Aeromicrobium sp.]
MSGPRPDATGFEASSTGDAEPVGSIAEEAFKLFRAMSPGVPAAADRSTSDPTVSDPTSSDHAGSDHVCSTGWCPVCHVVGFVRDHPDAVAAVTQSAAGLARSLRDLVDTALAPKPSQEDQ